MSKTLQRQLVGVTERGWRCGQTHQRARLSDADVALILELHDTHKLGYKRLAAKFDTPRKTIQQICRGLRRAKLPCHYRRAGGS